MSSDAQSDAMESRDRRKEIYRPRDTRYDTSVAAEVIELLSPIPLEILSPAGRHALMSKTPI